MLRRYLHWLILLLVASSPQVARAQAQGDGIRLGEALVLHLGLGAEIDYDSNVLYESTQTVGSFELRLTPHFELTTRPRRVRRKVELSLAGQFNYLEYLIADSNISRLRQFGVNASLQASFFPAYPYNFVVFDNFIRSTQPPYTLLPYNLDRDTNEAGTRGNLSPAGGRLTLNLGYLFGYDYFEPHGPNDPLQDFNLYYHRFDLRLAWRFLPKTALYISATEVLNRYIRPGNTNHPDSDPLHVEAGLQGLITPKLTVNVWAGYTNGFYVRGPNPNEPVAGLNVTWKPTMLSQGVLTYTHDFQNSQLGSYYDMDSIALAWTQLIWRITGFFRLQYINERYYGICVMTNTMIGTACTDTSAETIKDRVDNLITLDVRADYKVREWLIAFVGNGLQVNISNGRLALGTAPGTVPVNYTKDVVYLGLTANY